MSKIVFTSKNEDVWNDKNNWENKIKEVIKNYEEPEIICIGCDIKYLKYNNVNTQEQEEAKEFKCDECNECYYFESNLYSHYEKKH